MSLGNAAILRQISEDRALGSELLFAHKHKDVSPPFHIEMMDMWRAQDQFVCIQAFREGAKTTKAEEFMLMEAAFGNFKYAIIFGETYTKACQRIEAMKREAVMNDKIRSLFGDIKGSKWGENTMLLRNGTMIEAHGWEEEIRGYKWLDARPDRAYLDDIENKSMVRDTATVDQQWKRLYLELMPAMDTHTGKIRMTGTPLADDCMVNRAAASVDWVNGKFPICDRDIDDPEAQSLWPSRYPMEVIRRKRDTYAREGMLKQFNQEYMLISSGSVDKTFTEDMFRFVDVAPRSYAPRKAIVDPARTVNVKSSDQTGHVVASKLGSQIYVHESGGDYLQPDAIVQLGFDLSHRNDDAAVYIEKDSLDNWLMQPIRLRSLTTGQHLDITAMNAPRDVNKVEFIQGLQPYFAAGSIVFVGGKAKHARLIAQLLNWPVGLRDTLNALAYIQRVFAGFPVYPDFEQSNIVSGYTSGRSEGLVLGCNATGAETTAVLVAINGRNMTVLADWVSPLMPNDAIPDIAHLVRAVYPNRQVTAWVPGEIHDQQGRNALMAALGSAKLKPSRGEVSGVSRGALSPQIRTSMNGRRMFLVDENARATLNALSDGYSFGVRPGGERASEPARGPARALMEALESLTAAIGKPDNAQLGMQTNSVNSTGTPYLSALPRR